MLEATTQVETYRPDVRVFTLVVLTSGDKHKRDIAVIDFDPKDLEGQPLKEIFHKIIYICPKYVNEKTPVAYQEWLQAIDDTLDRQVDETQYSHPAILKIFEHIAEDQVTPQERAKMIDEAAERQTSEEDEQLGWRKAMLETARRMKAAGADPSFIASLTGLTEAEIDTLNIS